MPENNQVLTSPLSFLVPLINGITIVIQLLGST